MKSFTSAATVVLVTGVALTGMVAPATAVVKPSLLRVHNYTKVETAGPVKTITAKCRPGYRVISGSALTWDAWGYAYITRAQPYHSKSGDGYTVTARVKGFSGKWSVGADAICARGLSGVGIATATKNSVTSSGTATAYCARGTRVLGFGGQITGYTGAQLDGVAESHQGTTGYATGTNINARSAQTYKVTAYAVCAKAPKGWKIINETSAYDNWGDNGSPIFCPAGTRLFGAGGAVLGGHGRIRFEFYSFDNLLKGMNAMGYTDPVDYDFSYPWATKGTAVCAN